jgi:hypothetical protein
LLVQLRIVGVLVVAYFKVWVALAKVASCSRWQVVKDITNDDMLLSSRDGKRGKEAVK